MKRTALFLTIILLASLCNLGGVRRAHAAGEALSLLVNKALPGQQAKVIIDVANPDDIESFSLVLSFGAGTVLTLPTPQVFTRDTGYFPTSPVPNFVTVDRNNVKFYTAGNKVFISGFKPNMLGSGAVVTLPLQVSSAAVTSPVASSQVVALSGQFFRKSTQVVESFTQVSDTFVAGSPLPLLTVVMSGSGTGTVTGTPAGVNETIACASGEAANCTASFTSGTQVTLLPTVTGFSAFNGWSGNCTLSGNNCLVTLSADTTVTATFSSTANTMVQLSGTTPQTFATIQAAYNAAPAGTATIKVQDVLLVESPLLNAATKDVKLLGGYDPTFTTLTGYTTVQGKLSIRNGSLTIDRIIIKP